MEDAIEKNLDMKKALNPYEKYVSKVSAECYLWSRSNCTVGRAFITQVSNLNSILGMHYGAPRITQSDPSM